MEVLFATLRLLTEPWALLMLAAAFAYAIMNYLDEWQLERLDRSEDAVTEDKHVTTGGVGVLVITSGCFGLVVALVFALIAAFRGDLANLTSSGSEVALKAGLVGVLEVAYLIPYFYATKRSGTLEAAPLFQSIPIIALIIGFSLFNEVPPAIAIIGSITIVGGAFLLNLVPGTLRLDWKTIVLMLLASTIISFEYFIFKDAVREGSFIVAGFYNGVGMLCAGLLIFCFWPPYRREFLRFARPANGKHDWHSIRLQLANEVADAFSGLATQFASVLGPSVMVVSALNAYQPVFILIIGWFLARRGSEKHAEKLQGSEFLKKTVAIGLIALGTVLIAQH